MERLDEPKEYPRRSPDVWKGLIIIAIGSAFLLREIGVYIPHWVFSWEMLLIVIGFYIGVKHAFQNIAWVILMFIGGAFLLQDFIPEINFSHYLWPIGIIAVGLMILFRPRRLHNNHWHGRMHERRQERWQRKWERKNDRWNVTDNINNNNDDYMEVNAVFGGVKKNIISKNFRGGEVNAVFGGAEINLCQADITGSVVLEVNQVFGGTRLIVPSHWEIKSELIAVLGNVEDKRPVMKDSITDPNKVLILKGSAVFGGIDIQSC